MELACGLLALCAYIAFPQSFSAADRSPTVVVTGPTVIAFFEPVTSAEMEKDPDMNEALSDFQLYAGQARERLTKAGVKFHELYARSFRLRVGKKRSAFQPSQVKVGYYFIAPGKKPLIKYGVMTDSDLLQVATEYFGTSPH